MEFNTITNEINRRYVKDFITIELNRRKVSNIRKLGVFSKLKSIFNEIAPDKDFKKLTKQEADELAVKLVETYKKYWSIKSYMGVLRQFIKYIYNLDKKDNLPKQYRGIEVPSINKYKDAYRDESRIITPEEAFRLVEKNTKNHREAFAFMLLMDLGLRPHELLRAKVKDIRIDKLHHYHFKVGSNTKTGAREPMLIFSIPYVQRYLKWLKYEPEAPLFPVSEQVLWRTIKNISERKLSPYDLRASSMSYYGMYLTDQELKLRYGSEEYKHYVRLNREKLASKMDILTGRETNGNKDMDDLKKIAPKFCLECNNYSEYNSDICEVCKKPLDPKELVLKEKMDEVAHTIAWEYFKINPDRFKDIARSLGVEISKD